MDDVEHLEFIQNIIGNPETFKKILLLDKALSNMISDIIINEINETNIYKRMFDKTLKHKIRMNSIN